VLYRSAKQDPNRRFHALYGHLARSDILTRAWQEVRDNRGAPGVDGVSIADVEAAGVEEFLGELATALQGRSYRPASLRRVDIPKPGRPGETRPLSIPTVADRVVMAAAKIVLEPIFEAGFWPCSFGFRPKRSAIQACEAVRVAGNRGGEWVLDADLRNCFGSLRHDVVMSQVAKRVSDREMLKLIRSWLRVGTLADGAATDPGSGTPQGSPISPLLANVTLHVLDAMWQETSSRLGTLVRYCDDLVVVCASKARAEEARRRIAQTLDGLGVALHPEKTRIVCLTEGTSGFDFLGWHHHKVQSVRWPGRWYMQRWPSPRAMHAIRAKIRATTHRRYASQPVEWAVADLNRMLRGWGNYFRWGNSARKFSDLDGYVYERLERLVKVKYGPRGHMGRRRFHRLYRRLGVYRLPRTLRAGTAHA
jgi:group II intron reverse transcriptase/maturase